MQQNKNTNSISEIDAYCQNSPVTLVNIFTLKVDYVPVDSWVTCEKFIKEIRSIKAKAAGNMSVYQF